MDDKLLKISKALSDRTRLNIVKFILDEEKCVCEIIRFAKKSQPNISIQLKKLEDMGFIQSRREGKKVFYSLKEKKIKEIFALF